MTPAAVLFDLDDTLFDHRHGMRGALATLQGRYPCLQAWALPVFEARHSELLERIHLEVLAGRLTVDEARVRRFEELFTDAGEPSPADLAREAAVAYRIAYLAAWRLVPGSRAVIETLRAEGVRIGVVTNNVVSEQTRKIDTLGLRSLLDAIVISEAAGVAKPDPRIFALALADLGVDAEATVMVGDSWASDVQGARRGGLRPVWFNPDGRPQPEPADVGELRSFEPVADAVATILGS